MLPVLGNGDLRANRARAGAINTDKRRQAGFEALSLPFRQAGKDVIFKHKAIKARFVKPNNIIRQYAASRLNFHYKQWRDI
jgi:hypothetical protein